VVSEEGNDDNENVNRISLMKKGETIAK